MTDIDFDELDKAVSSLMGKAKPETDERSRENDAELARTLDINETLKPGERPAYNKIGEVAKRIGSETLPYEEEPQTIEELDKPQRQSAETLMPLSETVARPPVESQTPPIPTVKRPDTGRFMDVVHPSSDMRSAGVAPSLIVPERPSQNDTKSTPEPTVETVDPAPEVESPAPPPEPDTVEEETAQTPPQETLVSIDSDQEQSDGGSLPLSPFLPDAKVEKRPLGDMSATGAVASPFENSDEPSDESTLDSVVESGESKESESAVTITNGEIDKRDATEDEQRTIDPADLEKELPPEEAELQELKSHDATPPGPTHEDVRAVESGDTEKLTNGQSWQPVKSNDSKETNAIYDVNEYHQPLNHPASQKSGWGVVLLIVLIIAVCAGLGIVTYLSLAMGS